MNEQLAIAGGTPVVDPAEILPWPVLDERDRQAVMRVFDNGYLCGAEAPEVSALEHEWAAYVGRKHCLTTNSGTAALHMALAALGIGPGDEVLVPSYTFLASASCVLHAGAVPVFVDIDRDTCTIDPGKMEEKITPRTKAVIPVHIHGLPADMDGVMSIARKHGFHVVEDACQAHGAEYRGKKVGTFGALGAFSLNSSKNLCGGEGGLLVVDDDEYYMRAKMLRMFGDEIDDETKLRRYNASILGYQYRNLELPAALTRAQLTRLDEYNARRIENCSYLSERLKDIPGMHVPSVPGGRMHVYWMYTVEFYPEETDIEMAPEDFREAVEKALFMEGVQVGQWQTMPVPCQDIFQTKSGYAASGYPWKFIDEWKNRSYNCDDYPNALDFCRRYTVIAGIHPPNGPGLMKKYVVAFEKVFSNFKKVWEHRNDPVIAHYSGDLFRAR